LKQSGFRAAFPLARDLACPVAQGFAQKRETILVHGFVRRTQMANKAVALLGRVKTDSGWRRCPVLMGKNGRIKQEGQSRPTDWYWETLELLTSHDR
jgi:hypothetical protein